MTAETVTVDALLTHAINSFESGELTEAESTYRRVLAADPDHAHAHYLLGALLGMTGRLDEAMEHLDSAIRLDAGLADAHHDRANVFRAQNKVEAAVSDYRRAIELEPDNPAAHGNLGRLYRAAGQVSAAASCLAEATRLAPGDTQTRLLYCEVLTQLGEYGKAAEGYESVIAQEPGRIEAVNNLGVLLKATGRISESLDYFRRAVDLNPTLAMGHANLGMALLEGVEIEAAEERFRTAVSLAPYNAVANSNLLLCLNYRADVDPAGLVAAHRGYAKRLESGGLRSAPVTADANPTRRLRIAYVSPDFREHSVSRFIGPVLSAHDRVGFDVFCFANVNQPDAVTVRLKSTVGERWHDVTAMSDEEVAILVRAKEIDILVDLAGHSASNRLGVFALKPAPVQMTYLGYPATTGFSAVDYRLTDARADPPGHSESFHSEQLLRLPDCFLCFGPPGESPPVMPSPSSATGRITFGSFNNASKLNDQVLLVWSRVLNAVPDSRLVLKARQFADEPLRRRFQKRLKNLGIAEDRIEFSGWLDGHGSHLEQYNTIDIALDTFPYNGTTTTCEALWMGVPVVTLAGRLHASRVGASLLGSVGLGELTAESEDDYVARAKELAEDQARLASLRRGLRQRLQDSPLTDALRFTRNLEAAYRAAWQTYCESTKAPADPSRNVAEDASSGEALRLHIGGEQPREGWRILNAVPGPHVDYLGNCTDLSRFSNAEVDEVYASHILEHLGYQRELPTTLREIYRVLKPGGRLRISVPDLEVLCRLFLDSRFPESSKFELMRIIYGGQIDDYDFHKVGLTWTFMRRFLEDAGFREISRVDEFGLFDDTSTDRVEGQPISLNMVARK